MIAASPDRQAFHEFIARHSRLLLTTHVNPDGDGLGSEVAVALWLRALGKQVRVLNDSPVPAAYAFLTRHAPIEGFEPESAERAFNETGSASGGSRPCWTGIRCLSRWWTTTSRTRRASGR